MNSDLNSLARGPLAIAATLALVLATLWVLVARGATSLIVPAPNTVGQAFFGSLSAHNYQAAQQALSAALRAEVTPADLRALNEQLEQAEGGIEQAQGLDYHVTGDRAAAQVRVMLGNSREVLVEVPLTQEDGLWRVASLEPLQALMP